MMVKSKGSVPKNVGNHFRLRNCVLFVQISGNFYWKHGETFGELLRWLWPIKSKVFRCQNFQTSIDPIIYSSIPLSLNFTQIFGSTRISDNLCLLYIGLGGEVPF